MKEDEQKTRDTVKTGTALVAKSITERTPSPIDITVGKRRLSNPILRELCNKESGFAAACPRKKPAVRQEERDPYWVTNARERGGLKFETLQGNGARGPQNATAFPQ